MVGGEQGQSKLKKSAQDRQGFKDISSNDIIDRIIKSDCNNFKWHRQCYCWFTHKDKIKRLEKNYQKIEGTNCPRDLHSQFNHFYFYLGLFCRDEKSPKITHNVERIKTSEKILRFKTFDKKLCVALAECSDLISSGVKYHLNCYAIFLKKANKSQPSSDCFRLVESGADKLSKEESRYHIIRGLVQVLRSLFRK